MSDRVAVAMSGGLDSSVVAWLLSRGDVEVVGLSMLLWDHAEESRHGRCCAPLDLGDARRVARQCGIPHYTLRMEDEFRRSVVDPFVRDYLAGRTPLPCTQCNTWIKFDLFLERARSLGAGSIATGHYARIVHGEDGWELHAATNREKDQSYYLFELTQAQLAASRFPLGAKTKAEVRDLAREAGLVVAEKGESMEVCFVATGVKEFVEEQVESSPERFSTNPAPVPATMVRSDGKVLGHGDPYYRYTVGQRRGLGVAAGERLYVLKVDSQDNQVIVGTDDQLYVPGLIGERVHWIGSPPVGTVEAEIKIRSRHGGVLGQIRARDHRTVDIEFQQPQRGVAPGQAAVFYEGSRVLGGCWIRQALS